MWRGGEIGIQSKNPNNFITETLIAHPGRCTDQFGNANGKNGGIPPEIMHSPARRPGGVFGKMSGNFENKCLGHGEDLYDDCSQLSSALLSSDIPERVNSLPDRKDEIFDYSSPPHSDSNNNNNDNGTTNINTFPDVNILLKNCQCYMNWLPESTHSTLLLDKDELLGLVHAIDSKYISPAEKFELEESMRWYSFEYMSALGALSYFYIQLNKFPQARSCMLKAKDFIYYSSTTSSLAFSTNNEPAPPAEVSEFLSSFDYIWDYLCLYGSLKEWESTGVMELFPEMDLLAFPSNFHNLDKKLKAGVYCVKYYFFQFLLCKNPVEISLQIDTLRQAISCWPHYFEWFLCLQSALRVQRVKHHEFHHIYPWDAEIQACWTASLFAPHNPRCLLSGITLLAEICKNQVSETKWTVIRFGEFNFHGVMHVKSYMKEQAEKIMRLAPKSIRINTSLAQLFTSVLPYGHRDFRLGKECLERCLKSHPGSCKANHRMAEFYLSVETDYGKAEMYYNLALEANAESFPSLISKVECMMRAVEKRKGEIMAFLNGQIKMPHWEARQVGCLYFLKGLAQVATGETRDSVGSFITAYITCDRSLSFQELPNLHRKFGWPGWPSTSKLSFASIRRDLLREKTKNSLDSARQRMIQIILKYLNGADIAVNRQQAGQACKQNWRR